MPAFIVVLTCERGHVQKVRVETMTESEAIEYGHILDGTSSIFVLNPRTGRHASEIIGHCAHVEHDMKCGALFTTSVVPA